MLFSMLNYRDQGVYMASREKKQSEKREESSKSEIMQRFKSHPFIFVGTVIVLVIVIVAFVFVPAMGPDARGMDELVFGYYNKAPIKYVPNNFFAQVQQYLYQQIQQSESTDSNPIYIAYQIWRRAFEETVIHTGMLDEVKSAGFKVPTEIVDREMAEHPYFQENGRFSPARYRAMDNSARLSLWKQTQENIAIRSYITDIEGLKTPSREASFISSMGAPKRTFDAAIFPINSYPDSEIAAYVEANPELFKVMRLSKITVHSSERDARLVLNSIKSQATTFEEAARSNSQDWAADRGGDMGTIMAYELANELREEKDRDTVISLARGEISDLISLSGGWVFYRADEAARQADLSDPSLLSRAQYYIMTNLRGVAEDWLLSKVELFSSQAREIGFNEAAAAASVRSTNFGPIPLNFGNAALFSSISSAGVPELESAGTNLVFWRTAFSTPINSISSPVVIGDNIVVLLPLEETPSEESEIGFIESYYSYWVSSSSENSYRSYFLNNEKLDDRFQEMFSKMY
jgi:hypothetical protein